MTDVPFQPWCEADFAADPFVKALPWLVQQVWRCVLQTMWANHGWLPDDDAKIARLLGCDVRSWRAYRPLLQPRLLAEVDPVIGPILRQKRLRADWAHTLERIAKNKARTAPATAKRLSKSRQAANVTSANGHARNVERDEPRNESATRGRAKPEPQEPPSQGDGGSGSPNPTARSPAAKGSERAVGFVPSAKQPPKPTGITDFNAKWERMTPEQRAHIEGMTQRVKAGLPPIAAAAPEPQPQLKEEHHGRSGPDDAELDDFIRF